MHNFVHYHLFILPSWSGLGKVNLQAAILFGPAVGSTRNFCKALLVDPCTELGKKGLFWLT